MEVEYQVLTHLQENEQTTQRNISQRTGLSLGAVNILLKKMARKGLIKIEKLNTRTIRYILTPQGMKEKTRPI
jgi:DNA-binding MarR family transcriptional regulator